MSLPNSFGRNQLWEEWQHVESYSTKAADGTPPRISWREGGYVPSKIRVWLHNSDPI
jgi:hypothetical protein